MRSHFQFGFRVRETPFGKRILIDWPRAFSAYASCDSCAEVDRPAYLSAYQFSEEFRDYLHANDSTKGYAGTCWSQWVWFDVDDEDEPDTALRSTRKLIEFLGDRYGIADELLVWFSGSKGYHVGLPTSLWMPDASPLFAKSCRQLAESVSILSDIVIDLSVYDRVRLFRAPNSRHAKTGLFKRHLTLDELFLLDVGGIQNLAVEPKPFGIPDDPPVHEQAVIDWQTAVEAATATVCAVVRPVGTSPERLNRATRDFIINGTDPGDRHRLLYSSARNLGEFACSFELAFALLEPPARDSGLPPSDIRRQIECGLADEARKGGAQ